MFLFFTPEIRDNVAYFDETESRHAIKSLRMTSGDIIYFTDGMGSKYSGKIATAHDKRMTALISEVTLRVEKDMPNICLAFAPTKSGDRFEFMVEKCVEIGIVEFQPFISFHSDRKNVNTERLEKIAFSAMKQSMQLYSPKINELLSFSEAVKVFSARPGKNLIAYCGYDNLPLVGSINFEGIENINIFIGPEGDFSQEEYQLAIDFGFTGTGLGPNRLRTETAGLIACHWLKTMFY